MQLGVGLRKECRRKRVFSFVAINATIKIMKTGFNPLKWEYPDSCFKVNVWWVKFEFRPSYGALV